MFHVNFPPNQTLQISFQVMLSLELTNQLPFNQILLHGIICDSFGRKMSKSLGNVILPHQIISGTSLPDLQKSLELSASKGLIDTSELQKSLEGQRKMFPKGIPECGVDALRLTLCSQNIKQHFIQFDVDECDQNRLFFNKIWQATKYSINFAEKRKLKVMEMGELDESVLGDFDRWILSQLANFLEIFERSMDEFSFHVAIGRLKAFFG